MKTRQRVKKLAASVALVLVVALATMPVFAASAPVQAVLDQLATLQNADISPEWAPDIQHNEGIVQHLLDLYLACDAEQRGEFTEEQNTALRAYFTTLYQIQGKPASEVDALFDGGAPAASSAPEVASESEAPDSSVSAASQPESASQPASAAESEPPDSEAVAPGGVASGGPTTSMPATTYPPQTPKQEGWLALFGNKALGIGLLLLLAAVALVLVIRFLLAMRAADKGAALDAGAEARNEELFGEYYQQDPPEDTLAEAPEKGRASARDTTDAPAAAWPRGGQPVAEPAALRPGEINGEENAPENTEIMADGEPVKRKRGRPKGSVSKKKAPAPTLDQEPQQPPVTLRSFSGVERNGRPPKMTFRQGDPDDLDAIDD
ncbi:MAG: hypothetical protein AB7V55_05495 [Oscillospiraceae bacterium]